MKDQMKGCDCDVPYTSDPLLKGIEFFANKLFEAFVFLGLSIILHAAITVFK